MALKTVAAFIAQTASYLRRSRRPDASIPELQKGWTRETLERFRVDVDQRGEVSPAQPLLLLGNHISYLDIPVLMSAVDDVSFVAKKELQSWPLIGRAARAMISLWRGYLMPRRNEKIVIDY